MNEREALLAHLYGTDSHVPLLHALEGLDAEAAGKRPHGVPHSIHQILRHMSYWQEIAIARIRGENPPRPKTAAEGWTATVEPEGEAGWEDAVEEFSSGLWELQAYLEDPDADLGAPSEAERRRVARNEVLMVLGHNSYHLGQIVSLRQQLGLWPPPEGGSTW